MILDVGCGDRPIGDVNVDLYPGETYQRCIGKLCSALDVKKIANFIKASAEYLPFQTGTFSLVYSCHTLEHTKMPARALREMLRVSRKVVKIILPHRCGESWFKRSRRYNPSHLHYFNRQWFATFFKCVGLKNWRIEYSRYRYFPHDTLAWFRLPVEMKIIVHVGGDVYGR